MSPFDRFMIMNRMFGHASTFYAFLILCNILIPQALWIKKVRQTPIYLFIVAIIINVGMWLERFVIIVSSLERDFLPSSWADYSPTIWDWGTFLGTIGLFLTLMFVFIRLMPMISIFELRQLLPWPGRGKQHGGAH